MHLEPFLLEHWLTKHHFASPPVRYDLAASTGPKWTVEDVMALADEETRSRLGRLTVSYAPPSGSALLRTEIARCHRVDPDRVVVTTGASEAMSIVFCLMAEAGANVVLPSPAFPAISALARAWGHGVRHYELSREDGFAHRADDILSLVDGETKLVLVNTPHNPTGAVIEPPELQVLSEALAERRVPLLVDEVYHPLYFATPAPTAARLPNTIVIGDMSKAYSLSGLRIGWIIDADSGRRDRVVDARAYFTISNSPVTEFLAAVALQNRRVLLQRLESVCRSNLAQLHELVQAHEEVLSWVPPAGGTTAFPWLRSGGDSRRLCELLAERGVLVAPGDCFAFPNHFRIGLGAQASGFEDALAIAGEVIQSGRWE